MIEFDFEEKILHRLILQSPFVEDLGLLYGKMGITIFFFEYGRYKGCNVYTDIGEELLDGICEQIHSKLPFFFSSGLSGIGWGIEYLIQNHFIKGDSNVICEEIDEKILQINLRRLNDQTLETGLEGLYLYISARIQGTSIQKNPLPFDYAYLNDLNYMNSAFFISNRIRNPISLENILNSVLVDRDTYIFSPLGIANGLSGYLLTQLFMR